MATKRQAPERVDYRPTEDEMRTALKKLHRRKTELLALNPEAINQEADERPFDAWPPLWNETLAEIYGRDSIQYHEHQIRYLKLGPMVVMGGGFFGDGHRYDVMRARERYAEGKADALQTIETIERIFHERLEDAEGNAGEPLAAAVQQTQRVPDEMVLVGRLLRRFHSAARPLKQRHDKRPSFLIEDEYDVQDLLHALLRGLFDDIRPEESSPSYAGGASRLDFLLKAEQIVIETKMASDKLRDKQIGEQLMIDIQRYHAHPDCKHLICFVYDPHEHIKNPHGLEADLTRPHDGLDVRVIVSSH
jgi:hypothetical protein